MTLEYDQKWRHGFWGGGQGFYDDTTRVLVLVKTWVGDQILSEPVWRRFMNDPYLYPFHCYDSKLSTLKSSVSIFALNCENIFFKTFDQLFFFLQNFCGK